MRLRVAPPLYPSFCFVLVQQNPYRLTKKTYRSEEKKRNPLDSSSAKVRARKFANDKSKFTVAKILPWGRIDNAFSPALGARGSRLRSGLLFMRNSFRFQYGTLTRIRETVTERNLSPPVKTLARTEHRIIGGWWWCVENEFSHKICNC